ncbi:MAG: helix-turn-helix transcriptional regulator [Acidobacteriota bacterium]
MDSIGGRIGSDLERTRLALRRLIEASEYSQRRLELQLGFGRGQLSRLLSGKVALKYHHLVAMLTVLGIEPARFFAGVYPPVWDQPRHGSEDQQLRRLVGIGLVVLDEVERRLLRCEAALDELARRGLIED